MNNLVITLKQKYGIPVSIHQSRFLTIDEYKYIEHQIVTEINRIYQTVPDTMINQKYRTRALIQLSNLEYRILELYEDPEPITIVRYFIKKKNNSLILSGEAYIVYSTAFELLVRPVCNANKLQKISRNKLILVKLTKAQKFLLQLQNKL